MPALSELPAVAAVDRRFGRACNTASVWEQATISVSRSAMEKPCELIGLGVPCWGLASEVKLAASPWRIHVHERLRGAWPRLKISTVGNGPHLFFAMSAAVVTGKSIGLHFFEPRYRWMCQRLLEQGPPRIFGWINRGGPQLGATGYFCNADRFVLHASGSFDVHLRVGRRFSIAEVWGEVVPDEEFAPHLPVGYIDVADDVEVDQRLTPLPQCTRHWADAAVSAPAWNNSEHAADLGESGEDEGHSEEGSEEEWCEEEEIESELCEDPDDQEAE